MIRTKVLFVLLASVLLLFQYACAAEKPADFSYGKVQPLAEAKPKKPVKIKVHRNAKGEYTWDLTGDDPDEVARADKRLKKALGLQ
ncbi:MAG: hypothetical protein RBT37_02635 [Dissulfurispiraceae bacterium]|jgi:hypothetical protein|nr:hypothetical protein [Dissulfurispiraceae bacterium]